VYQVAIFRKKVPNFASMPFLHLLKPQIVSQKPKKLKKSEKIYHTKFQKPQKNIQKFHQVDQKFQKNFQVAIFQKKYSKNFAENSKKNIPKVPKKMTKVPKVDTNRKKKFQVDT